MSATAAWAAAVAEQCRMPGYRVEGRGRTWTVELSEFDGLGE